MTKSKWKKSSNGNLFIKLDYGTITEFQKNKFRYRYQIKGCRKSKTLNSTTKIDAVKEVKNTLNIISSDSIEETAMVVNIAKGFNNPEQNLFLTDIWSYYSRHPNKATPKTISEIISYKTDLKSFIEYIDDVNVTIRDITYDRVYDYIEILRTRKITAHTHNRILRRLRKIFSTLSEFRDFDNPFDKKIFMRKKTSEDEVDVYKQPFSREESEKILHVLDDDKYKVLNKGEIKVIYYIGMFTGQRLKDCVLLKWSKIDLSNSVISLKQFKTGKSVSIPISSELLILLKATKKHKVNEFVSPNVAERYMKVDKRGKNIGGNNVNKDVLRVVKWIGLEPAIKVPGLNKSISQYGFHSLRHSFATYCLNAGIDKSIVKSILGADSEIIEKVYEHISAKNNLAAVESIFGGNFESDKDKINNVLNYIKSHNLTDIHFKTITKLLA